MTSRTSQDFRCLVASVSEPVFKPVPRPVDVSDAEQFPNIAEAIAHARRIKAMEADNAG